MLSDDWLTWYRHFINHEKFLVCDLNLKVIEEVGGGDEQRKILDQYLTSGIVSTRSIQRFKRCPILKTFNQKVKTSVNFQSLRPQGKWGVGDDAAFNFRPVPNIRQSINKI